MTKQNKQGNQQTTNKHNQRNQHSQHNHHPSLDARCKTHVLNFIAKSLDSLKLLVPFIALEGVRLMISCHHYVARSIGITAFSWWEVV